MRKALLTAKNLDFSKFSCKNKYTHFKQSVWTTSSCSRLMFNTLGLEKNVNEAENNGKDINLQLYGISWN
jgi:hypothetical protein